MTSKMESCSAVRRLILTFVRLASCSKFLLVQKATLVLVSCLENGIDSGGKHSTMVHGVHSFVDLALRKLSILVQVSGMEDESCIEFLEGRFHAFKNGLVAGAIPHSPLA